jgi:hypothetical protein
MRLRRSSPRWPNATTTWPCAISRVAWRLRLSAGGGGAKERGVGAPCGACRCDTEFVLSRRGRHGRVPPAAATSCCRGDDATGYGHDPRYCHGPVCSGRPRAQLILCSNHGADSTCGRVIAVGSDYSDHGHRNEADAICPGWCRGSAIYPGNLAQLARNYAACFALAHRKVWTSQRRPETTPQNSGAHIHERRPR